MQFFKKEKKDVYYFVGTAIVLFFIGIFIGFNQKESINGILNIEKTSSKEGVDLDPFWKAWKEIDQKHPNAKNTDSQERVYGAIKGLVGSLEDPYTSFFTPEEKKMFEEDISGNFSGVGMEVGIKDGILTVIAPLKETPAYKAGIKSGDKILKIDEVVTSDINIEKAIKLIRGERGTTVSLTLFREDFKEPKVISIVRDIIEIPTLDTEKVEGDIFVIKLYSFSGTSTKLFRDAMKEFYDSKYKKLILDLRGNTGGYLEAAIDISSWFLPSGKTVVIEDYGENQKQKTYKSYGYDLLNGDIKMAVLIDQGSASASEIVAGALQDHKKALLVGQKSYGKGSVQEVVDITKDTMLKVTVAKWLTPNGNSISEKGLDPDFEVKFNSEDFSQKGKDAQMEKAVDLLNNL